MALRNNVTFDSLEAQLHSSVSPAAISYVKEVAAFHESVKRPPVLTHGDLSSFNILLRDDKVVGIIDWKPVGWLPYYWEYTRAWHANPQNVFWQREVLNFLDPYEEELRMGKLRLTYFEEIQLLLSFPSKQLPPSTLARPMSVPCFDQTPQPQSAQCLRKCGRTKQIQFSAGGCVEKVPLPI